jgi:hypothetical protein
MMSSMFFWQHAQVAERQTRYIQGVVSLRV